MTRNDYEVYLQNFNARNYQGVLDYFADEFEVIFAGYCLNSRQQVLDFYTFLHAYLKEEIRITRYVSDADTIALEAVVRLEGIKTLPAEVLKEKGFERLVGLEPGQVVELPQFIHYHLKDGKFSRAYCAMFEPVTS